MENKKLKQSDIKDFLSHKAIDRCWTATGKELFIDFENGGILIVNVVDGKLSYGIKKDE